MRREGFFFFFFKRTVGDIVGPGQAACGLGGPGPAQQEFYSCRARPGLGSGSPGPARPAGDCRPADQVNGLRHGFFVLGPCWAWVGQWARHGPCTVFSCQARAGLGPPTQSYTPSWDALTTGLSRVSHPEPNLLMFESLSRNLFRVLSLLQM